MREINVSELTDVIERLCIEANTHLPEDVKCAIQSCRAAEDGDIAKGILDNIVKNYEIADSENVPICQDTGVACVFLEIGQDVHLVGGELREAVDEGVRRGYTNGYLRKSVVADPIRRGNTALYRDRARRKHQDHSRPERLRKRKYEYDKNVQALCRTGRDQEFHS